MPETGKCRKLTRFTVLRAEAKGAGVVVTKLSAGEVVRVVEWSGRWMRLENPRQGMGLGWTYRRYSERWPCPA
jgi:hypothetical protein